MKKLYLLPALLLLLASCEKQPIKTLPKATKEGKQTAGCLIDGKAFIAEGYSTGTSRQEAVAATMLTYDSTFILRLAAPDQRSITLLLRHVHGPGEFQLASNTVYYPGASPYLCSNQAYLNTPGEGYNTPGFFGTTADYTGKVKLTAVNWTKKIVAGTFEFTGFDSRVAQTTRVTGGRFDARY